MENQTSTRPGCIGSTGIVRSSAWMWDFAPPHSRFAFSGGSDTTPTISITLASSSGSVENRNDSARQGLIP